MALRIRRSAIGVLLLALSVGAADGSSQTTTISASCPLVRDTLIRQHTPAQSYNGYPKGWAHSAVEGIPGSWIETLLQFDLTTCLPPAARVSAASLELYVTNASTYSFTVDELRRPFTAAANWITYASGARWAIPGAMGEATDLGAWIASIDSPPAGPLTVTLASSVVQSWVGSSTASIVIRPVGVPGTNLAPVGLGFRSREHTSGRPPALRVVYSPAVDTAPSSFKIVAWNVNYGKGATAKAPGMTCPFPELKNNAQCQIADDPLTAIDERSEERRGSAWGVGLTQQYLHDAVLDDREVIALLLTEVNGGTCFTQDDLMSVVRTAWPRAEISRSDRDNWIVARWGFVRNAPSYAATDLPPCGFKDYDDEGRLVGWPSSYREGIQWGRIYAADPDGDGDVGAEVRTLNVFNAHWPHRGLTAEGTPFFCSTNATVTRDFMSSPVAGIDLTSEPRILGGDLNTEDLARTYDNDCEPVGGHRGFDVLRATGFFDAFAAGTTPATPTPDGATGMIGRPSTESCYRNYSHNGPFMPYKRIDYQWFMGGGSPDTRLRVLGFELIGADEFGNCVPSDHLGTKVRYEWY